MSEVKFVDGLMVKQPHPNAPDFVKAKISIKKEDLIKWLQSQSGEWINLDIKESKTGKWYAQVDDWKPNGEGQNPSQPQPGEQPMPPKNVDYGSAPKDVDINDVPF